MNIRTRFLVTLVVLAMAAAGCTGPAVPAPGGPAGELGEIFQIALPRLVVDLDNEGTPSILGIPPALLKLAGIDASSFGLPAETVQQLVDNNVQHIEMAVVDGGLRLWVNGEALPFVAFDAASLERALGLAAGFGTEVPDIVQRFLPLLSRLGLDLVLRLPVQPGAEEIPLTSPGEARQAQIAPTTDPASMIVKFEIKYDEDGRPSIMGIDAGDFLPEFLPVETIQNLQAQNIQTLELRSKADGFTIYVNGEPLPTLVWDTATLENMAAVLGQVLPADSAMIPVIAALLPYLDRGDVDILLHLPVAPGAEPVRAQMHP